MVTVALKWKRTVLNTNQCQIELPSETLLVLWWSEDSRLPASVLRPSYLVFAESEHSVRTLHYTKAHSANFLLTQKYTWGLLWILHLPVSICRCCIDVFYDCLLAYTRGVDNSAHFSNACGPHCLFMFWSSCRITLNITDISFVSNE